MTRKMLKQLILWTLVWMIPLCVSLAGAYYVHTIGKEVRQTEGLNFVNHGLLPAATMIAIALVMFGCATHLTYIGKLWNFKKDDKSNKSNKSDTKKVNEFIKEIKRGDHER